MILWSNDFFNIIVFHFSPIYIIVGHGLFSRLVLSVNNVVYRRPSVMYLITNTYLFQNTVIYIFYQSLSKQNLRFRKGVANISTAQKFPRSQNIAIIIFGFIVTVAVAFDISIIIICLGDYHIRRNIWCMGQYPIGMYLFYSF